MKTYDPYSPDFDPDNEQFVRYIMSSFACSTEIAKKIIKSAEMNGRMESIKNVCQNSGAQKRRT